MSQDSIIYGRRVSGTFPLVKHGRTVWYEQRFECREHKDHYFPESVMSAADPVCLICHGHFSVIYREVHPSMAELMPSVKSARIQEKVAKLGRPGFPPPDHIEIRSLARKPWERFWARLWGGV